MNELKTIRWEIHDDIGFIWLDTPPSNVMNKRFFLELSWLTGNFINTSGAKALIISGTGRHFSSGADINDLLSAALLENSCNNGVSEHVPGFLMENNRSFLFFEELDIPVIAAIQGVCIGSALELALFCHFRICNEHALLSFPETGFNLMPGCGGTQNLPALCGYPKAIELIFGDVALNAQEALELNIVDAIFPRKTLLDSCISLAQAIASGYDKSLKIAYLKKLRLYA